MTEIYSQGWIRTSQLNEERTVHDPFYSNLEKYYQEENSGLEDRVATLEKIIIALIKKVEDQNRKLQHRNDIDITAISDAGFWLTEEDDVWDTL